MRMVDWQIAQLYKQHRMIEPYESALVTETPKGTAIPYGQDEDGYILRISRTSCLTNFGTGAAVDPKHLPIPSEVHGLSFVPPATCLLALTVEEVQIPSGYCARLELLPQYAMAGLMLAQWSLPPRHPRERLAISLVNHMVSPVWLYLEEGVVKLVLEEVATLSREEGDQQRGPVALVRGGRLVS